MTRPGQPLPLPRIGRKFIRIPLRVVDDTGADVTPEAVAVAVLPYRRTPDADTAWTAATLTGGALRVLLAGPDAPPDDAIPVPDPGGDLWVRVTDPTETDAVLAGQIQVR